MKPTKLSLGLLLVLIAAPEARSEIAGGNEEARPEFRVRSEVRGSLLTGESRDLGRYDGGQAEAKLEAGTPEARVEAKAVAGAISVRQEPDSDGFAGLTIKGTADVVPGSLSLSIAPGFLAFPDEERMGLAAGAELRLLRDRIRLSLEGFANQLDLGEQYGAEHGGRAGVRLLVGTNASLGIEASLAAVMDGSGNRRGVRAYGTIPLGEVLFVSGEAVVDRYELRPDRGGEAGTAVDNRVRLTLGVGAGF